MPSSPILITGSTGQVGGALLSLFPDALAPTRAELDLASPSNIRAYLQANKPRWILNPAAYTAVDRAESEPALAHAINAQAPGILGEEARRMGAGVLHFSTDYVFPGSGAEPWLESDSTGPLGVYGATKLAGEQALAASGAAHLILRTSWVYAATGKNFLLTVLRVARERQEMKIVDDQHGAPTAAPDLARVAFELVRFGDGLAGPRPPADTLAALSGVYHLAAAGETTWFAFAQEALRLRRVAEPAAEFARLVPIPSSDYPTPARRPLNSRLDCSKLRRTFGIELPPWQRSLAAVSANL